MGTIDQNRLRIIDIEDAMMRCAEKEISIKLKTGSGDFTEPIKNILEQRRNLCIEYFKAKSTDESVNKISRDYFVYLNNLILNCINIPLNSSTYGN